MNKMEKNVTHIFSVLYSFITIKKKRVWDRVLHNYVTKK